MSKIVYTKYGKVKSRTGEFYGDVGSCYTTPGNVHTNDMYKDPLFAALEGDVDELMNKPRRFFDHLLSIMEYKRDHDPLIDKGNRREYWEHMIRGCEMWLSAVNNGLYGQVIKLATPGDKEAKDLKKEYEQN